MTALVLEFVGRLTLKEAMQTLNAQQQCLLAEGHSRETRVIGDLSGLTDVDTAALAVMLQLDREVRQRFSQPIVWRRTPVNLISLARLTSLLDVFEWEDGVPQ